MTGEIAFETERCIVRTWRPEDAERVFDIYGRWAVAQWLGSTPRAMETLDEARSLVERWGELNASEPVAGRWAVERRSDAVVAGTVILVPLPDGVAEFEVGWHFHPDSWGQGLASESARGAIEWGFVRGLDEILAVVRPDNTPSIAVCRRLGRMRWVGRRSTTRPSSSCSGRRNERGDRRGRGPAHRPRRTSARPGPERSANPGPTARTHRQRSSVARRLSTVHRRAGPRSAPGGPSPWQAFYLLVKAWLTDIRPI